MAIDPPASQVSPDQLDDHEDHAEHDGHGQLLDGLQ